MVNNHYVPQFILRNFCKDEKIQYYDLKSKKVEPRATRSVFSEKGYYPDNIEKGLCQKIEVQFANVLHNKILNNRYRIVLDSNDMLVLKKYLIITMLRMRDDDNEQNILFRELKKNGFIPEDASDKELFSGDFYKNINEVLECDNIDKLMDLCFSSKNLTLFTFVKDSVYSYNVFVRSDNSKEDFIIPDRGWVRYRGPNAVKKLNALNNMLDIRYDPYVEILLSMSTPQDYAVYPLARNLAIVSVSSAYKICLSDSPYKVNYPEEAPSLSACLGFGTSDTFATPSNRIRRDGTKEYIYNVQQLNRNDVSFLNGLLLDNADRYFGYAELERVKYSLELKDKAQ